MQSPRITSDQTFLTERQPRSVADMLRFLPGVSTTTNSRGETIARIRGADERQTQVFLDGAPLAVPWDGRIDLGVLPAGLISSIEIAKGAVPIEYGTNAVSGVIDLMTTTRQTPGLDASSQVGSAGFATASIVGEADIGDFRVLVAASGLSRNDEPIARRSALPFSQADDGNRTNTDLSSGALFAALGYEKDGFAARGSLLHFAAQRGIAPESDRNPLVAAPRYWRYPNIGLTQLSLNSRLDLGNEMQLRMVLWNQWFAQTINAYRNLDFAQLRSRQEDADNTLGGRLTLSKTVENLNFRLNGSYQTSKHAQTDTNFATGLAGPRLVYRQNLLTLGAEMDAPIGPARATIGVAYDRSINPLTGDKPAQPASDALAFSIGLQAHLNDEMLVKLSGGKRTRFPSSRELFGEALGRFLINPDLKPETAWLLDAEWLWRRDESDVSVNLFYARGRDTIGQRVVKVKGAGLRQRFNQSGTHAFGVDALANIRLSDAIGAEIFGTLLSATADENDNGLGRLLQRPTYESGGALRLMPIEPLLLRLEYRRVGPSVDLDAEGNRVDLAAGDEINFRIRMRVAQRGQSSVSVTFAVDNITNGLISPQAGLPLPGRTMRMGLMVD